MLIHADLHVAHTRLIAKAWLIPDCGRKFKENPIAALCPAGVETEASLKIGAIEKEGPTLAIHLTLRLGGTSALSDKELEILAAAAPALHPTPTLDASSL